jgi:hypothetical protein
MVGRGPNWFGSESGQVTGCCGWGNESSGLRKMQGISRLAEELLDSHA